jgi:hypothetical protein
MPAVIRSFKRELLVGTYVHSTKNHLIEERSSSVKDNGGFYHDSIAFFLPGRRRQLGISNWEIVNSNWETESGIRKLLTVNWKPLTVDRITGPFYYTFTWRIGRPRCFRRVSPEKRVCARAVGSPLRPVPSRSRGWDAPRWRVCLPYFFPRKSAAS